MLLNLDSNKIATIIVPVIAAVLGASTLISFIMSAYLTPNITIDFDVNDKNPDKLKFIIKNTGNAAAKNVIITINTPASIIDHTIFSTENYTEAKVNNSYFIELHIPRLVQGGGSLIAIETVLPREFNRVYGQFSVYVTYDQGSVSKIVTNSQEPLPAWDQFNLFWQRYGTTILYFVTFVIFIVSAWFFLKAWRIKHKLLIKQIVPKQLQLKSQGNYITILGANFGNKGSVWLEYYPPLSQREIEIYSISPFSTEKVNDPEYVAGLKERIEYHATYDPNRLEKQIDVTPQKVGRVEKREDNRIVVGLDRVMNELKSGKYVVRVEKGGVLSPIESNTVFEVV